MVARLFQDTYSKTLIPKHFHDSLLYRRPYMDH